MIYKLFVNIHIILSFSCLSQKVTNDSIRFIEYYIDFELVEKTEYVYSEGKINRLIIDYKENDVYLTKFLFFKDTIYEISFKNNEFTDSLISYYDNDTLKKTKSYLIPELYRAFTNQSNKAEIEHTTFNKKGDIYKIVSIDQFTGDTFQTYIDYQYLEDRLLVSKEYRTFNGKNGFLNRYITNLDTVPIRIDSFFYNENLLIRKITYTENKFSMEEMYVYDELNNVIEYHTISGNFSSKQLYTYKTKGNKKITIVHQVLKANTSIDDVNKYIHNKNGQIEKYFYIKEGKIQREIIYKYDKRNRLKEQLEYSRTNNRKKRILYSKKVFTYQ